MTPGLNTRFVRWFEDGHVADALCGSDAFFVEDFTYRGEHDFVLAVDQLLAWAEQGHNEKASRGFNEAIGRLISKKELRSALRLLHAYRLLSAATGITVAFDETNLLTLLADSVRGAAAEIARDSSLRALVLGATDDFPNLRTMVGMD